MMGYLTRRNHVKRDQGTISSLGKDASKKPNTGVIAVNPNRPALPERHQKRITTIPFPTELREPDSFDAIPVDEDEEEEDEGEGEDGEWSPYFIAS